MGSDTQAGVERRAIEWHLRLRDGDDAAWDAFAAWLADDPRHAEAYDRIERTDLAIETLLPDVVFREAANDENEREAEPDAAPPPRAHRRWWGGAALAASAAAAVLLVVPHPGTDRYEIATGPGQRRTIALDAATSVVLNGATRLILDRKDARFAALESGAALFRVHHDGRHPFVLEVGANRVEDVGTVFEAVRDAGSVRLAVAEGAVRYDRGGQAVALRAGQALTDPGANGAIRVTSTPADAIGAWEKGRLVYSGAPLSRVADDLGRSLGVRIVVAPAIAERPFSGTIALDAGDPRRIARLGRVLDVRLVAAADGWTMGPLAGAGR